MNSAALSHFETPLSLYEQLMALPENLTGEIIDGELFVQPRPSARHSNSETGLSAALRPPFHRGKDGPGGWWILAEPEIHFVRDTVVAVPDLAGWRRERMPALPDGHRFEIAPNWLCEILSPATQQKDRARKLPLYARFGVAHVWLVDPLARLLEAYRLSADGWVLLATLQEDEEVCLPPFEAIRFPLSDLWT
jgi:Uma2 family endonuclease